MSRGSSFDLSEADIAHLREKYPISFHPDGHGIDVKDILVALHCAELSSKAETTSLSTSKSAQLQAAHDLFKKYKRKDEDLGNQDHFPVHGQGAHRRTYVCEWKWVEYLINKCRDGEVPHIKLLLHHLTLSPTTEVRLSKFKVVWEDALKQGLGHVEELQGPSALRRMHNLTRGKKDGEVVGSFECWEQFELFKEAIEVETGTQFSKSRTKVKGNTFLVEFMCKCGGHAYWLIRKVEAKADSTRMNPGSAKVECPARIRIRMTLSYADHLGLRKKAVQSGSETSLHTSVQAKVQLRHEGHVPNSAADIMSLPTHPR